MYSQLWAMACPSTQHSIPYARCLQTLANGPELMHQNNHSGHSTVKKSYMSALQASFFVLDHCRVARWGAAFLGNWSKKPSGTIYSRSNSLGQGSAMIQHEGGSCKAEWQAFITAMSGMIILVELGLWFGDCCSSQTGHHWRNSSGNYVISDIASHS